VDDKAVVGMDISALKSVFPMILPKTGAYLALSEA
jgi:hypothetical protein